MSKALQMLELQNKLNLVVNKEWITAGSPWHRAIIVEIAETFDHLGYKWWKAAPTLDVVQIHIELVDIWHFIMSQILVWENLEGGNCKGKVNELFTGSEIETNKFLSMDRIETMSALDAMNSDVSVTLNQGLMIPAEVKTSMLTSSFIRLCVAAGLGLDQLFKLYVGKNALNTFRQQNGYKGGSYIKNWALFPNSAAIEDNQMLESILDTPEAQTSGNLFDFTMEQMGNEYSKVLQYHKEIVTK